MTGPKPFLTDGQLKIDYLTDEPLTHKLQINLDVATSGGAWFVLNRLGANYPWATAVSELVALLQPIFNPATQLVDATLYQRVSGILQPVAQQGIGLPGTAGTPTIRASQVTLTLRSALYNLERLVLLGAATAVPYKQTIATAGGSLGNIGRDMINPAPGHLGNWWKEKDDTFLVSTLNIVTAFNKKSRRRLGLV